MATQKQLAARALFARRARSGAFHRVRRAGRRVRTRFSRRRSLGGEPVMARRRMRRSYGRFRSRFHRPHKQSMASKLTSIGALLIGASPVIEQAKANLIDGGGNFQGFADTVGALYSAGLTKGSFRWDYALQAYGPIVAGIAFKKGMSYLLRIAKLKF